MAIDSLGLQAGRNLATTTQDTKEGKSALSEDTHNRTLAGITSESPELNLTEDGQNLNRIESELLTCPDVDNKRVAAIKHALGQNTLTFNTEEIANKLLDIDEQLF